MTSTYIDAGLEWLLRYGLQGQTGYNDQAALYSTNVPPTQTSTASTLGVDSLTVQTIQGGWTYTLNGTLHQELAANVIGFTLSSALAGRTYYGIVIQSSASGILAWAATLPTPYTVPSGGGTLAVQVTLTDQNCS